MLHFIAKRFDKLLRAKHKANEIVFKHSSIYVLPSKSGVGFIGVALLNFILGINYQNNLILAVYYIMLVILVTSLLYGYANLKGLRLKLITAQADHEGAETDAIFELNTNKVRFDISIYHVNSSALKTMNTLSEGHICNLHLPLKRGVHTLDKFRITSHYPFGLVTVWSYLISTTPIYVYPKPLPNSAELHSFIDKSNMNSDIIDSNGNEFNELKRYQSGMSIHRVSWRHFAKSQTLLVKDYEETQQFNVGFDFNTLSGSIEERLSKLCFLMLEAEKNHHPFAVKLPSRTLEMGSGTLHCQRGLEMLSEY